MQCRITDAHFFLDEITALQYAEQELSHALCLKEDPEHAIGGVDLSWNPQDERVLELGDVLHKEHWGKARRSWACTWTAFCAVILSDAEQGRTWPSILC